MYYELKATFFFNCTKIKQSIRQVRTCNILFWSSWSFRGLRNVCIKYTADFINGIKKLCKHGYINALMHTHYIQTAFRSNDNTNYSFLSSLLARLCHIFGDSLPMTLFKYVPLVNMHNLPQELCLLTNSSPFHSSRLCIVSFTFNFIFR